MCNGLSYRMPDAIGWSRPFSVAIRLDFGLQHARSVMLMSPGCLRGPIFWGASPKLGDIEVIVSTLRWCDSATPDETHAVCPSQCPVKA